MQASGELRSEFRTAMRRLAASVCVVTAERGGKAYGMAVTAVTSLSMEPPSLLVCVNHSAKIHAALGEGARFCVNVLHRDHEVVARRFGDASLTSEERFAVGDWDRSGECGPVLRGAQAVIECELANRFEFGTHSICVGRVRRIALGARIEPLLYADGVYF